MLSILLRLFYESKPDWLMKLVEQGKETVQHEESSERAEVSITCLVWYTSSNIDTSNLRKSLKSGNQSISQSVILNIFKRNLFKFVI